MFRIGCDIGGTFTDVIVFDERSGKITVTKEPTTTRKPEIGAYKAIEMAMEKGKLKPKDARFISHATTVATNAIIGQIGLELSKTGLITTRGFRDLIEIGRQIRPDPYDFFVDKPRPLIPRYLRKEVTERIGHDGSILLGLNEGEARKVIRELKEEGVDSIAVCSLFSFVNPTHEKRINELIQEEYPEVDVTLSHEILPEFREYERTTTTVLNAALRSLIGEYVDKLEKALYDLGLSCELLIMQSNGRIMKSEMATRNPVRIIESGPAAGVVAASYMSKLVNLPNLVSFDMGGTTTKVCLIENGEPTFTTDFEVGGLTASGRAVVGSGWPVRVPVIDLVEIGAGGGSIAWIDAGGALRVGPRSAGAEPGPACYGLGGHKPTVTDAYLLLGVINPEYFLGGKMKINHSYSEKSVKEEIAEVLGIDIIKAANGIAKVANSNMSRALRIVTIERGKDPRELPIIAFGGAGPMVASNLMEDLGFVSCIIPVAPGLFSAHGLLVTDIGHDYSMTYLSRTDSIEIKLLNNCFTKLERQGFEDLIREGIASNQILISKTIDMRYVGQSYELNIDVANEAIDESVLRTLEERFHQVHEERYGYSAKGEPTEVVNLRLAATGPTKPLRMKKRSKKGKDASRAKKFKREVYFEKEDEKVKCEVYDRYKLDPGNEIYGPAVIEQGDTTTLIQPNQMAKVDSYDQLIILRAN
ncbi:MAG: hydantoinase/oxoprolinase family protein [Candidatus Hodarchaeota archaeon]